MRREEREKKRGDSVKGRDRDIVRDGESRMKEERETVKGKRREGDERD